MAADGAQEARAYATGAETWGTAADGAREARAHVMGAETWGMATDGAREVRVHAMGAETHCTAADGARDGAETRGVQRGGVWARVRGVNAGETRAMAMCAPVTSSSSYSKSPEIKARSSEVRRVPGNGFSSCAAPTFSRVQGISDGGRNGFPEYAGTESVQSWPTP